MNLVDKAIVFAVDKHEGQYRKSLGIPYVSHCFDVMKRLRLYDVEDPEILAAAILHDTIEDTHATREDLLAEFGERVTTIVMECTRPEVEGETREQKFEYLFTFYQKSTAALLLKVADRVCNVSDYRWVPDSRKYAAKYALQAYPVYDALLQRIAFKELPYTVQDDLKEMQSIIWEKAPDFSIFTPGQLTIVKAILFAKR